ncbi:IstB-like ATP-binding protein, partial [Gemella haemolysans]
DINELEIRNLASLNFIENNKNLIFIGNSGVGKTHLATAIGRLAASSRYSTYFIKCHDLIANLKAALAENRLEQRLKHYSKYRLLIIDEIGYLPLEKGDERLLFQLIDRRYEKKSIIATSNIPFSEWATLFSDDKVASAILDRLLHHAHVVPIIGNSYRLKDHVSFE